MRHVVLLAACLALAGCTTPEGPGGDRDDNLFLNVVADGPWSARFVLPTDGGRGVDDWARDMRVSGGDAAWRVEDVDGPRLRIDGNGTVRMEALASVVDAPCCAEAYLDARWSDGRTLQGGASVEVLAGRLDVVGFAWETVSCTGEGCGDGTGRVCSQDVRWDGRDWSPGRHAGEVRRHAEC